MHLSMVEMVTARFDILVGLQKKKVNTSLPSAEGTKTYSANSTHEF